MKKQIFLVLGILLAMQFAYSQNLMFCAMLEKTVAGPQYGGQLSAQIRSQWAFGGFYQASFSQNQENTKSGNSFYGVVVNAPLARSEKVNFYLNARLGFVDRYFLALVPGFESELKMSQKISFGISTSIRMTYPSAGVKVYFKI